MCVPLMLTILNFFSNQVQEMNDARICLSDSFDDTERCRVTITIGANMNTISTLEWDGHRIEANTSEFLSLLESRPFWISWDWTTGSLIVQVGQGPLYSGEPFLQGSVDDLFDVITITLVKGYYSYKDESGKSGNFAQ